MNDTVHALVALAAYLAVLVVCWTAAGLRRGVASRTTRGLAAAIGLGLLVAQIWAPRSTLYPFVKWGMYASPNPPQYIRQYWLVNEAGREVLLPFGLVAFSSPWTVEDRLDQLIRHCRCTAGDDVVDETLSALASLYYGRTNKRVDEIIVRDVGLIDSPQRRAVVRYTWKRKG